MKYYTKEWYNLKYNCDYTSFTKKILDKMYSEEEIQVFYDKALKKEIASRREGYYDPPYDFSDEFELLEECDFNPEDWVLVDDDKGIGMLPKNKEEVRAFYEAERKRYEEKYKNKEPFDPAYIAADFKSNFQSRCKSVVDELPLWVTQKVDLRLLALDLLPQSVYDQLKQEERQNRKEFKKMNKRADNAVWEAYSKLPERIQANFGFYDDSVLEFHKKRKDYEMFLRKGVGYTMEGNTPYERVLFQNATLLEKDKGVITRPHLENGRYYSYCDYICDEIYALNDGRFEVHMMVYCSDLKYITLQCEDIQLEENIKYPR